MKTCYTSDQFLSKVQEFKVDFATANQLTGVFCPKGHLLLVHPILSQEEETMNSLQQQIEQFEAKSGPGLVEQFREWIRGRVSTKDDA